ncbi:unnamed protein product [Dicrocoelium dendriticum]|nr:unnamed protein product [Dicrocoelium dendriticum]
MVCFRNMLVIVMLLATPHFVESTQLATCAQGCSGYLPNMCALCASQAYDESCEAEVDVYYRCLKTCKESPTVPDLPLL